MLYFSIQTFTPFAPNLKGSCNSCSKYETILLSSFSLFSDAIIIFFPIRLYFLLSRLNSSSIGCAIFFCVEKTLICWLGNNIFNHPSRQAWFHSSIAQYLERTNFKEFFVFQHQYLSLKGFVLIAHRWQEGLPREKRTSQLDFWVVSTTSYMYIFYILRLWLQKLKYYLNKIHYRTF